MTLDYILKNIIPFNLEFIQKVVTCYNYYDLQCSKQGRIL
jgi:hypothetical protein